jgi:N-acetylglucosamine kinase-like BadF-type ATPase
MPTGTPESKSNREDSFNKTGIDPNKLVDFIRKGNPTNAELKVLGMVLNAKGEERNEKENEITQNSRQKLAEILKGKRE